MTIMTGIHSLPLSHILARKLNTNIADKYLAKLCGSSLPSSHVYNLKNQQTAGGSCLLWDGMWKSVYDYDMIYTGLFLNQHTP